MVKESATSRLSRETWVAGAIEVIAESGLDAVAVEPLAARLGVTKGSFYWHFGGRADLIEAVLATWEQTATGAVIANLVPIADPRERLRAILTLTISHGNDQRAELALLGAASDPNVAAAIGRVNEARLGFLTQIFTDLGYRKKTAGVRSRIAYSAYLGHLNLQSALDGRLPKAATDNYIEQYLTMLLAPDPAARLSRSDHFASELAGPARKRLSLTGRNR